MTMTHNQELLQTNLRLNAPGDSRALAVQHTMTLALRNEGS